MITNFNLFKPKPAPPKIGDYVIMNPQFYNLYGIIIDTGKESYYSKDPDLYLIEIQTHVDDDTSEKLKTDFINNSDIIRTKNTPLKHQNIFKNWAGNYPNYLWSLAKYFDLYKSKDEYDNAVEEIEMKKDANKYNI
jgi:hypothetical protein